MEKILKTDQDREQFRNWIKALRSGEFKQGSCYLQDYEGGYCCLGVACKVTIPGDLISLDQYKRMSGTMPIYQTYSPRWIIDIANVQLGSLASLPVLNDTEGYTFSMIADLLEKHTEELGA